MSFQTPYYFSSLGCPDLDLPGMVDLCRRYQFGGVEVRTLEGSNDLPSVLSVKYGNPKSLRDCLGRARDYVAVLSTSLKLVRPTAEDLSAFLDYLPWADAMDVKWLRVFDGGSPTDSQVLQEALKTVDWWEKVRVERGSKVELLVETHDGLVTGESIVEFAAKAPSVRILWDAHNTWKRSGEDIWKTLEQVSGIISHLHVKDSVSRPSARHPFTYVLPGRGEFPGKELIARLISMGYKGSIGYEWERLWHPYLPPLIDALKEFNGIWRNEGKLGCI